MSTLPLRAALATLALAAPGLAGDISWETTYEGALERNKAEGKVLFVAINMDGERANERMATKVYHEREITDLAALTVNLIASNYEHGAADRPCKRFGSLTCDQHRDVDLRVRELVLKPDADGYVIAPQHAWLRADGSVILSVPFEITASELAWCFHTALKIVDPEYAGVAKGRAPRRLILGDVADGRGDGAAQTLTRDEVLAEIDKIKKGEYGRGGEREPAVRRVATSGEKEAMELIEQELKIAHNPGGRGGGRRGGGQREDGSERPDRRITLIHWIGVASPPEYWELIAPFTLDSNDELRAEAAVALEQLAAPKSVKAIAKALSKEELPRIEKNLLRALGAAGAEDKKTAKKLLAVLKKEKAELLRTNALVALGYLVQDEDVKAALAASFREGSGNDPAAAAIAMGLSRDPSWLELLGGSGLTSADGPVGAAVAAASAVLKGAELVTLRAPLRQVAGDEIERERLFGRERDE